MMSLVLLIGVAGFNVRLYRNAVFQSDRDAVARAQEGLKVLAGFEELHKERTGGYTDSLVELAKTSGDVDTFHNLLLDIFDPDGFRFYATKTSYTLRARARDRRSTELEISDSRN